LCARCHLGYALACAWVPVAHPWIWSAATDHNKQLGDIFLVLDFMEYDLGGLLNRGTEFTIPEIKCLSKQLLNGIAPKAMGQSGSLAECHKPATGACRPALPACKQHPSPGPQGCQPAAEQGGHLEDCRLWWVASSCVPCALPSHPVRPPLLHTPPLSHTFAFPPPPLLVAVAGLARALSLEGRNTGTVCTVSWRKASWSTSPSCNQSIHLGGGVNSGGTAHRSFFWEAEITTLPSTCGVPGASSRSSSPVRRFSRVHGLEGFVQVRVSR
jgi:hypothetical protein